MGSLPLKPVKEELGFLAPGHIGTETLFNNGVPISVTQTEGTGIKGSAEVYSNYDNYIARARSFNFYKPEHRLLDAAGRKQAKRLLHMDLGSEFLLKRNTYLHSGSCSLPMVRTSGSGSLTRRYEGYFFPQSYNVAASSPLWPAMTYPSYAEYAGYGTKAISATIPTNPASSLGQFIGELREGLPYLNKRARDATGLAQRASNKYLELEFATKPFLSDLKSMARTLKEHDKQLDYLERGSGKLTRRRLNFPILHEETTVSSSASRSAIPTPTSPLAVVGAWSQVRKTTTTYWFSGAYSYYFDRGQYRDKNAAFLKNADILFGIDPRRPDLLWNLTPWTWLADWTFDLGDILQNVTALQRDSLVIKWAYIMCHKTIVDTYTLDAPGYHATQSFGTEIKMRRKSSPFGFGLTPGDFTNRQKAILSALGMSLGAGVLY